MKKFMVIEKFNLGCKDQVYQRFHQHGRMLPEGLHYIHSWLEKKGDRCFQLMETANPDLFDTWTNKWNDLTEFEIIELGDKPAAELNL